MKHFLLHKIKNFKQTHKKINPFLLTPFYGLCGFLIILVLYQFNGYSILFGTDHPPGSQSIEKNTSESDFHDYLQDLFRTEAASNTLNLHFTLADPASAQISDYPITFGEVDRKSESRQLAILENVKKELENFDVSNMSISSQLTYDVLIDSIDLNLERAPYYYYDEMLSSTNGVQNEYPILLAEYTFRSKKDIEDYLKLLSQYDNYFDQVCNFEKEKSKHGLFMNEKAVMNLIEQCKAFLPNHSKESFLETTFLERLNEISSLSEKEKNSYIKQNQKILKEHVYPAYQNLITVLISLKKTGKNDQGLCYFKEGKKYYQLLVKSLTGSNRTVPELQKLVEIHRNQSLTELSKLMNKINNNNSTKQKEEKRKKSSHKLITAASYAVLPTRTPEEILEDLKTKIKSAFPSVPDTNYTVKIVSEKLQDFLAPAFYLTSPLDQYQDNCIYINPGNNYSNIELFTTLAHEGYPGHLYQTVYSYSSKLPPIRYLLYHGGYTEGWATYVEMLSYYYAGLDENLAAALMQNQDATLSLYATIDMGIHYDGWALGDTADFLGSYGITDTSVISKIYQVIIENPGNYLKYYIGYLEFLQLKSQAKEYYQNDYSDLLFHTAVLDMGSSPFYILEKYLTRYYGCHNE